MKPILTALLGFVTTFFAYECATAENKVVNPLTGLPKNKKPYVTSFEHDIQPLISKPESALDEQAKKPYFHIVQEDEFLDKLVGLYDVDLENILNANPDIKNPNLIFPEQRVRIPGYFVSVYTVQEGDFIKKIAKKYNIQWEAIVAANPYLEDPNLIFPGQKLNIPLTDPNHKPAAQLPKKVASKPALEERITYLTSPIDYTNLMSDAEFTDCKSCTQEQIQKYLESIGSVLKDPIESTLFSKEIVRLAEKYNINPLLLLARAQTEKSIVTRHDATLEELKEIMGYGIPDNGVRQDKTLGYLVQLEESARILRKHFNEFKQGAKIPVNYDTGTIVPKNAATYSLFRYTPHTIDIKLDRKGGGNYLFMSVYEHFRKRLTPQQKRDRIPKHEIKQNTTATC